MPIIDQPHSLLLKYGHEPLYLDPDSGVLGGTYEMNTTHEIISVLADICNGIGAQLRFGYQETRRGQAVHYVSVFSKDHPDWIGAFINKMIVHPRLHIRTACIILSNFIIKTNPYTANDTDLSYEENPVTKIGYRIVFHSLRTLGFLRDDGEEKIDLEDFVGTETCDACCE